MVQSTSERTGEFEIIANYFKDLTGQNGVVLGIGDDGAILDLLTNVDTQLVVATDSLVENVHFPQDASPYHIAQRALCVNLSDMAAMGANPRWFTLALTLPVEYAKPVWLKEFSAGLAEVAEEFHCSLIGGDTTCGPLTISITMLGEVTSGIALKRSGAKVGDSIYVTGHLADGGAGLAVVTHKNISKDISHSIRERLIHRFYRPQPKVSEGIDLTAVASSCIDISDGLIADIDHLCKSSGVSANVVTNKLPVLNDVTSGFPDDYLDWALYGGDDYQLCFTVPEENIDKLTGWIVDGRLVATRIGKIISCGELGPEVLLDDSPVNNSQKGFDHFGC